MSVIDYEIIRNKPTTITLVALFEGSVNIDLAFDLLPITPIQLPSQRRNKQKIKIPHVPIPGAILSLRYKGKTRGIIKRANGKCFKNSITIDISTREKNLCLKLSSNKFQICGATSEEQAREGCQYILDYLNQIQEELTYMNNNKEKIGTTLRKLKEITKGEELIRPESISITSGVDLETIEPPSNTTKDYTIRQEVELEHYKDEEFDLRIAKFLYRDAKDFLYHSHFSANIDWIASLTNLTKGKLVLTQIGIVMVNLNYDLGFDVNRSGLASLIDGKEGFYASYDNTIHNNVTVQLPYKSSENDFIARKKNKEPCHTFIIYQSGQVTQSGPGGELMKNAYYKFNNLIRELLKNNKDEIMVTGRPRKFYFIPHFTEK